MAGQGSKKNELAPSSSSGAQAPPTMDVPINLLEKLLKQMRPYLNLGPMLSLLTQPPAIQSTPIPTHSEVTKAVEEPSEGTETMAVEVNVEDKASDKIEITTEEEPRDIPAPEEAQISQEVETEEGQEKEATDFEATRKWEDDPPVIGDLERTKVDEGIEREQVIVPADKEKNVEVQENAPAEEVGEDDYDDLIMLTLQDVLAIQPNIPTPAAKSVQEGEDAGVQENAPAERMPRRRRKLIIEETRETSEEDDEDRRQRLLSERKRKGKEPAGPSRKKTRPASITVTIREHSPTRSDRSPPAEKVPVTHPYNKKVHVKIDDHLLQQVVRFDNPKLEDECAKMISPGKMVNAGKKLHHPSLQRLGEEALFLVYITGIGFEWLLDIEMPELPVAIAQEFFTSFRFKTTADLIAKSISFRVFTREVKMSLTEWSVRLGLYSTKQANKGEWLERHIGQPKNDLDFNQQTA
ncbi:hypothetical protein AAHA92_10169 [Salvia divinorum]|uniref:Uncharacterized protein n=1 Tax=Salvia divinorum TaxID=28513 RepID=A0ABD1HTR0_SALDI